MTGWLLTLRDRPITEPQRHRALAVATVLLACTTALLILTRPVAHQPDTHAAAAATETSRPDPPGPARTPAPSDDALPPAAARVSKAFLRGYLAYLYGHGTADQITDASGALVRSLEANPPRVSPAMRERVPRVLSLQSTPAPSAYLIGASALIGDGGLVSYRIGLLLTSQHGRLLVNALNGD
jgi:hypothetical protein